MGIVSGNGIVSVSSCEACAEYDITINNSASYVLLPTATGSGNVRRDTRTNRMFVDRTVEGLHIWLPYTFNLSDPLQYTNDNVGANCAILYENELPSGMTVVNATKNANAPLIVGNGISYAWRVLPTATPVRRLLVVKMSSDSASTSWTAFLSGDDNVLPRILGNTTVAQLSSNITPIGGGDVPIDVSEPIFMIVDTTIASGNTIVFTPSTLIGQESIAQMSDLGTYADPLFGVTNFDVVNTLKLDYIFAVEVA